MTSNAVVVSEGGVPTGGHETTRPTQVVDHPSRWASEDGHRTWIGATSAFRRSLFDDFDALDVDLLPYGLDLILAFRAVLTGTHHYLSQPLVAWRQHASNTHKLAGAHGGEGGAGDPHRSFVLMALAQKIRDVGSLLRVDRTNNGLLAAKRCCDDVFMRKFEEWSRLRNRSHPRHGDDAPGGVAPVRSVAIPPIVTLFAGERHHFGRGTRLGDVAARWSGFHEPEGHGNWTERVALLTFRRGDVGSAQLRISFTAHAPGGRRARVLLSVDRGAEREVTLDGEGIVETEVTFGLQSAPGCFSLLIQAPDAATPSADGSGEDIRLLGVCLHWLELIRP